MAKAKKQVVETTVKFPEPTIHDFSVISVPVITEKSMKLMQEGNKIVLKVAKDANADEIKNAFESIFGKKVEKVNTVNVRAKAKRMGRFEGKVYQAPTADLLSRRKKLTKAEYLRLVNTAKQKGNERLNLLIQTICGTGIRVSELQYITVEAVKCGEAVVSLKGKTRTVFIVKELKQKLLRYAAEQKISSGAIFITRSGKPMSRTNIWREMKSLCEQAGVNPQKVFPHNLRHLFARTFYGIEKDIAKLADILGHSSINTTRIYIITTGNEHRQRMENMRLII